MSESTRILVIDDDESIRKSLTAALELKGYIVDTAENGGEAIKKSNANYYRLALIDIRLPDMEGTELLTTIKDTTPKMVKLILTGYATLQNATKAANKGADGYIMKPINMDCLLDMIAERLKKQQEEKNTARKQSKNTLRQEPKN